MAREEGRSQKVEGRRRKPIIEGVKPVAFAVVGLCIWVAGVAAQGAAPHAVQHLTVSASSAAAPARRGQRLPLFVDVTPMPEIHVYAPGAADYQPIALSI